MTHLHVRYALKADAVFRLEIRFREDRDYTIVGEFSKETTENTITVPVPVRRSDSVSLRFSGTGEAIIMAIGKTFSEGSDR